MEERKDEEHKPVNTPVDAVQVTGQVLIGLRRQVVRLPWSTGVRSTPNATHAIAVLFLASSNNLIWSNRTLFRTRFHAGNSTEDVPFRFAVWAAEESWIKQGPNECGS
jgi:hypothetical protein